MLPAEDPMTDHFRPDCVRLKIVPGAVFALGQLLGELLSGKAAKLRLSVLFLVRSSSSGGASGTVDHALSDRRRDKWRHASGTGTRAVWVSGRAGVACLPLMVFAAAFSVFGPGPASAEQGEIPVFVIGQDGGLSPFVLRRDSKEFREVVFPSIAEARARVEVRAIGEEPLRARFHVDGIEGNSSSRWACEDYVHFAPQVPVDEADNTAPHVVCVDVWIRTCRDDANFFCTEVGALVHGAGSLESIFGTGRADSYPIPSDYKGDGLLPLWLARSEELLHPLGA